MTTLSNKIRQITAILTGNDARNGYNELGVAIYKDANAYGEHGRMQVSHRARGLNNVEVPFAFPSLTDAPPLTAKLFLDIWAAFESQGYIAHHLVSYGGIKPGTPQEATMGNVAVQPVTGHPVFDGQPLNLNQARLWSTNPGDDLDVPAFLRRGNQPPMTNQQSLGRLGKTPERHDAMVERVGRLVAAARNAMPQALKERLEEDDLKEGQWREMFLTGLQININNRSAARDVSEGMILDHADAFIRTWFERYEFGVGCYKTFLTEIPMEMKQRLEDELNEFERATLFGNIKTTMLTYALSSAPGHDDAVWVRREGDSVLYATMQQNAPQGKQQG